MFALAKNHAFTDGNKRTAYVACLSFLDLNGINLGAPTAIELATLAIANNLLDRGGLIGLLRQLVILLKEDEKYYAATYFRRQTPGRGYELLG